MSTKHENTFQNILYVKISNHMDLNIFVTLKYSDIRIIPKFIPNKEMNYVPQLSNILLNNIKMEALVNLIDSVNNIKR